MVKISFLGDISLNDNYISLYNEGENPFSDLQMLLHESDYVVGNLECMAKGDEGENILKRPRLATTVETLNYLKYLNLSVACLAHNHVFDQLLSGYLKTTNFLKNNNIDFLGAGNSKEEAAERRIFSNSGIKIGINAICTGTKF